MYLFLLTGYCILRTADCLLSKKGVEVKKSILFLLAAFNTWVFAQDYPIRPVPFTSVKVEDSFWAPRIRRNHDVTIPIAIDQCYSTGRVDNFLIAAKLKPGKFLTQYPFDDTDIYKIVEGASYSLQTFPDKKLEARIDTLIHFVQLAQEPDGYLYTCRTINPENPHPWAGKKRWEKDPELSHELYNCGHMYEAAAAHFRATGKRTLLDVALKNADLLCRDFGPGKLSYYPGHQIVEMGLVKLYRITGKREYLDLAAFFLDARKNGSEYNQAHKPVKDQTEPVGHAVRATYMYSGMTDAAALAGKTEYIPALDAIWVNLLKNKIYITGGIGAEAGHEGFSAPYVLPNLKAYNETCASIGMVYWSHRMFLLEGDSRFVDVLERVLYNGLISGVSLSGDRFFYPNPLESDGNDERSAWFGCACCPSNVCRFIPSVPGYAYAAAGNRVYVNLFIQSSAGIPIGTNTIRLVQKTAYPWDGAVVLKVNPEKSAEFEISIRIPGWARNEPLPGDLYGFDKEGEAGPAVIMVNGQLCPFTLEKGYAVLKRKWKKNDTIELSLSMPVRRILANPSVKDDFGKTALQRGPMVYCAEWPDFSGCRVSDIVLGKDVPLSAEFRPDLLGGVTVIRGKASTFKRTETDTVQSETDFTAIPYFAWANRGKGEMAVWIPTRAVPSKP
jgi:uncharacterized protein